MCFTSCRESLADISDVKSAKNSVTLRPSRMALSMFIGINMLPAESITVSDRGKKKDVEL